MRIRHRKEIGKLTFQALAFSHNESHDVNLFMCCRTERCSLRKEVLLGY